MCSPSPEIFVNLFFVNKLYFIRARGERSHVHITVTECTDGEPPRKNDETCSQITTGTGGMSCTCASGFKGQYSDGELNKV